MSFSVTDPSRATKWVAGALVVGYAVITLIPLLWIIATGFKSPTDSIAYPPVVVFEPTLEGYVNLFTDRAKSLYLSPIGSGTCTPAPRRPT